MSQPQQPSWGPGQPPQYRSPGPSYQGPGYQGFAGQGFGGQGFGGQGFGGQGFGSNHHQQTWGGLPPAPQSPWQQPGTASQPYGPPGWAPPPRRGTGALTYVLVGLIAVTVVAIGGLVAVAASGAGTRSYVNEEYTAPPPDLNPSELPFPSTVDEAEQWLTNNAVYAQSMPQPVRCDVEPLPADADKATAETHMNDFVGCLVGAWVTPVEAAGFELPRPSVTVYEPGQTVTSACGELPSQNAVYCGADQRIYYATDLNELTGPLRQHRFGADLVVAHEFGHAVQGRTGILGARAGIVSATSPSKAEENLLTRRSEAQADCFATLATRAAAQALGMTSAEESSALRVFRSLGSKPGSSHPTPATRQAWAGIGFETDRVGACNSWSAPEREVE